MSRPEMNAPMDSVEAAGPTTPFYSPREEILSPLASTSQQQQQLSSPTKMASPSSPIGNPTQDHTTPNGKPKRTPSASPPVFKRPSLSSRRTRSGSVGLLRRFTSRGSTLASDDTHGDADSLPTESPGRIDREALSRPKGKYKSGIRLDNNNLILQGGNEQDAWLESSFVPETQPDQNAIDEEEARLALASGGTAAAKAYWLNNGYGRTIFPAEERAREEAAMRATMAAQATSQRQFPSTPSRYSPTNQMEQANQHRSSGQPLRPPPLQAMSSQDSSNSGSRASAALGSQTSSTSQLAGIDWAQRPAIKPGTASSSGLQSPATSMPAAQQRSPSSPLQQSMSEAEHDMTVVQKSPAASSVRSKRRTFLGLGSKSTDKVDKTIGTRRSNGKDVEEREETTPRRRYPNTKELDLLAAELSNEASWERQIHSLNIQQGQWAQSPSGSQTPADSVMGSSSYGRGLNGSNSAGLAINNGDASAYSSPSSVSLATMPNGFQPFTAPFAQKHRSASPASSIPSSPLSVPFDLSGAVGARLAAGSAKGPSPAPLLSTTQKNEVGETPHEMFVGLDSGPYPLLPADAMPDGGASGYTTPRKGRLGSESGGHAGSITGLKSSVLSMSLHNPETESQGLTRPVKSSRTTPWGSRVPSRTVTPKTSGKDLKELAKQQAAATQLPKSRRGSLTLVASGGSGRRRASGDSSKGTAGNGPVVPTPVLEDPVPLSRPAPVLQEQQSPRSRSATPDRSGQLEVSKTSSKPARHSIMGVFNKSRENIDSSVKQSMGKARKGEDDEAQASLAKLVSSTMQEGGLTSTSQARASPLKVTDAAGPGVTTDPPTGQPAVKRPPPLQTNSNASSPRRNFSPARFFQQQSPGNSQQTRALNSASNSPRATNGSVPSTPAKQQRDDGMSVSPPSTARSTTTTVQSAASPVSQKRPGGLKRLFSSFKSSPKKASSAHTNGSAPPSPAVTKGSQGTPSPISSESPQEAESGRRPIITAGPASTAGPQSRGQSRSKSPTANQMTQSIPTYPPGTLPAQTTATGNGNHQQLAPRHDSSVDSSTQDLATSYEAGVAWSSSTAGSTAAAGQSSADHYLVKGGTVTDSSQGTVRGPLPLDFSRGHREREVVNV